MVAKPYMLLTYTYIMHVKFLTYLPPVELFDVHGSSQLPISV